VVYPPEKKIKIKMAPVITYKNGKRIRRYAPLQRRKKFPKEVRSLVAGKE
jgi:hypothetical protein